MFSFTFSFFLFRAEKYRKRNEETQYEETEEKIKAEITMFVSSMKMRRFFITMMFLFR